ncbi:dihydrofolate reductase family protein [Candidatus Nitrosocosmicus agrestis]|uniref:dihydrofolate reductase family protein n=1 Tax=Candidatus Nitrosocosmicus agrestis TaxID=2563600 RepID=UPI001916DDED|nr:dihydrofolate reductase family protein [Candidatus Nitrosocosmicus sp. SS]MDR4492747.1 dihydrofolate reductase family protein [Candidatus Nitrosocosmicus sp.]
MNDNKTPVRKLRLQVHMSIDGCIAGPNNEMDWLIWDNGYLKYIDNITESVDTIIMGRKMVDGFIPFWTEVASKPDNPMYKIAKKMVEIPKVVFTKTLKKSDWQNTDIATGDLRDEIAKLKNQDTRGDIIVYGGISFDSSLIKEKLIDEFYLFINPIVLGSGKTIFKDTAEIQKLSLIESKVFDCGLVLLHYEVKKN